MVIKLAKMLLSMSFEVVSTLPISSAGVTGIRSVWKLKDLAPHSVQSEFGHTMLMAPGEMCVHTVQGPSKLVLHHLRHTQQPYE